MRLALDIGPELWRKPGGVQRSIERAQLAEELGFDTVWASEDPDGWDAFSALSVLARSTERIHLGTGVTNSYYRHPNLISASVATLDHASDGRAFLGLGRGEPDWYRTAFGMEIGSPLRRVRETVDLLRQWWSPEQRATGEGEITVRGWKREFSPVGNPSIYIAATGPKMQALAGEIADGIRFNLLGSLPFLKRGIALIHALPGMERQLDGLETEFDVEAIISRVRRHMRTDEILARGGSFADLRREGDLEAARKAIPLELVDRVAVVGPPARVLPRLADYAALGITDIFADPAQVRHPEVRTELLSL
jgi:alkanesulfonate monooxygenase SsuD/methylene tetrahydromethanopterin reductase-like flavin-dependent oxidoreductase (luciferase family)